MDTSTPTTDPPRWRVDPLDDGDVAPPGGSHRGLFPGADMYDETCDGSAPTSADELVPDPAVEAVDGVKVRVEDFPTYAEVPAPPARRWCECGDVLADHGDRDMSGDQRGACVVEGCGCVEFNDSGGHPLPDATVTVEHPDGTTTGPYPATIEETDDGR